MERRVINRIVNEHGEVTNELYEGDLAKVIRAATKEFLMGTMEFNQNEPFIKVFRRNLFELSTQLTGNESTLLFYLIGFIRYETGVLSYDNGVVLTKESIASDIGVCQKTIERIMSSLISKQILGRHKVGDHACYTANPFIFMKGQRINQTLYKLFKDTIWAK